MTENEPQTTASRAEQLADPELSREGADQVADELLAFLHERVFDFARTWGAMDNGWDDGGSGTPEERRRAMQVAAEDALDRLIIGSQRLDYTGGYSYRPGGEGDEWHEVPVVTVEA